MQATAMPWAKNWWALAIRGVLAIVFGIAALAWPAAAFLVLVLLFGAYAFVDGLFAIAGAAQRHEEHGRWWALLVEGIAGVVLGIVTFFWTEVTGTVLILFIGAWALFTGVLELWAAISLRRVIRGELWLVLAGVASIVLGVLVFAEPMFAAIAVATIIGVYAIIFGVMLLGLSLRLRGWVSPTGPSRQS